MTEGSRVLCNGLIRDWVNWYYQQERSSWKCLASGGSKALACAVVGTRLGKVLENEEFWDSVLFFFNHPSIDFVQVGSVEDYLQSQKVAWRGRVGGRGVRQATAASSRLQDEGDEGSAVGR